MLKLYDLTTEYKREPLGLDEAQPRFGWKLDSDQQDTVQAPTDCKSCRAGMLYGIPGAWRARRVF
mgnify:CR=1 FL=1